MENQPIFSRRLSGGTRVYYIDVHADSKGQHYISLSEIPTDKAPVKKERQRVFIHAQNVDKFARAFTEVLDFIQDRKSETDGKADGTPDTPDGGKCQ